MNDSRPPVARNLVNILRAGLDAAAQAEHNVACEDRSVPAYQVGQTS